MMRPMSSPSPDDGSRPASAFSSDVLPVTRGVAYRHTQRGPRSAGPDQSPRGRVRGGGPWNRMAFEMRDVQSPVRCPAAKPWVVRRPGQ